MNARLLSMLLAITGTLPAQAQVYRPEDIGTAYSLRLDPEAQGRFDAFARPPRGANVERRVEAWTLFGRLGNFSVENRPAYPDDGFVLRRSAGPRAGTVSVGFRKRF